MQVDDLPSYTIMAAATNHPELLDRASWRRFQVRLPLPLPDQRALARYLEEFSKRLGEPLGYEPGVLARRLGRISYAEAEQFCLDVRRRSVLAIAEKSVATIVNEQLDVWDARARAGQTDKGGMRSGRAASTDPPKR